MHVPYPPKLPSKSIFPTTRRLATLVLTCAGIVGATFGAVSWVSQVKSDYDALKLEVRRADLRFAELAADQATDRRASEKQLGVCAKKNGQLGIAVSKLILVLEARRGSHGATLQDAKDAVNRAQMLHLGGDEI